MDAWAGHVKAVTDPVIQRLDKIEGRLDEVMEMIKMRN